MGRIRITRFKSQNRSSFIFLKILLIGYFLLVLAGYLTSATTAYYSNHQWMDGSITIGTWESEEEEQQSSEETGGIEAEITSEQNVEPEEKRMKQ